MRYLLSKAQAIAIIRCLPAHCDISRRVQIALFDAAAVGAEMVDVELTEPEVEEIRRVVDRLLPF